MNRKGKVFQIVGNILELEFKKEISRKRYMFLSSVGFLVTLSLWSLVSYKGYINPIFLPAPTDVIRESIALFTKHNFLYDIILSTGRVLTGFIVSAFLAIPLGILMGSFTVFEGLFSPFLGVMRYLPAAAFIPLLILWLGIGFWQKVAVLFISIFFYLLLLIFDVTRNIRTDYIETALTLGATKWQIISKVVIPASLPGIWNSLRTIMGVGWTMIVVAELVAAESGIGAMIIEAQRFVQTPRIIVGIIVVGILGLLSDAFFRIGFKVLFKWA